MILPRSLLILAALFTIHCETAQSQSQSPFRLNDQKEFARGPVRYQYSINLLARINSTLKIQTFNNSRAIYWAVAQYKSDFTSYDQTPAPTAIYNVANPNIRSSADLKSQYVCGPSESECNQITIPSFNNLKYLGTYSYQSLINTLDSLYVDYNISAFISPIQVECDSCNVSSSSIQLLANRQIKLSCSILIAQNSDFQPSVDFRFHSCLEMNRSVENVSGKYKNKLNISSDDANVVVYKLTKTCTREFDKYDHNTNFQCELIPFMQSNLPIELQPTVSYEKLKLLLDVNYGPEYTQMSSYSFNQTALVSSNRFINFSCPFISNPDPIFYWRVAQVSYADNETSSINTSDNNLRRRLSETDFLQTGKEYSVPHNLDIGQYVFECKAETLGLINNTSNPVKFYLNIVPNPHLTKKGVVLISDRSSASNNSIIGVICGIVGIVIVVAAIALIYVKKLRRENSKDDMEKAKDIDIGLGDDSNPLHGMANGKNTKSVGQKVAAGLGMPPNALNTYAAIATQAAAAAAQQRSHMENSSQLMFSGANNQSNAQKSYNNPGFFESATQQQHNQVTGNGNNQFMVATGQLESPPPYEPMTQNQFVGHSAHTTPKKFINTGNNFGGHMMSHASSNNSGLHLNQDNLHYTTVDQLNPINV